MYFIIRKNLTFVTFFLYCFDKGKKAFLEQLDAFELLEPYLGLNVIKLEETLLKHILTPVDRQEMQLS